MPSKPKKPCKHPGCNQLVPSNARYCEKHVAMHQSDVKSASEKGYDSRWRRARAGFLKAHPLCVKCLEQGKLVGATVVDHIIPHRGDKELFWDVSNWQPLCKPCHDRKTMTEDRYQEFRF